MTTRSPSVAAVAQSATGVTRTVVTHDDADGADEVIVLDPRVVVRGPAGLDHDLTVGILASGRMKLVDDLADGDVIVLVDPQRQHWLEAATPPARPIVVVRAQGFEGADVIAAARAGAVGFIDGDSAAHTVVEAVSLAVAGRSVLSPLTARTLLDALHGEHVSEPTADVSIDLTRRERQILVSIEQGHSVKQTARSIGVAPKTIENVQGRLFRKLGVRNRVEALVRAHELGVLSVDGVDVGELVERRSL